MSRESKNLISGKYTRWKRFAAAAFIFVFFLLLEIVYLWSYSEYRFSDRYRTDFNISANFVNWALSPAWGDYTADRIDYVLHYLPLAGLAAAVITLLLWLTLSRLGNYAGVEHGSAHWATQKELKDFREAKNNIPLADGVYRTKKAELDNFNVAGIGGPGTGKSFCMVIPAIEAVTNPHYEQGSFICTDTKGSLYRSTSKMVKERGMKVYVLNLANPEYSNCYNPIELIHGELAETEIAQLALAYAKNVRDEEASVGDDIWEKTFKALLVSVWFYQYRFEINPYNHRAETKALWRTAELIRGIRMTEGKIADCELYNIVESIRVVDPLSPVVANFDYVNAGAGETIASVVFTAGSKMEFLSYSAIECLTRKNEIPLDALADEPTAVFLNYNVGSPYRAVASLFMEQAFMNLYYVAEHKYDQTLPRRVDFLLDELPNICRIYTLPERLSTSREYNIAITLIMQSIEQLKRGYKNAENTLLNNCAVKILLGSTEKDTLELFSKMLGDTTTTERDHSHNKGNRGSRSESDKGVKRSLATEEELLTMKNDNCVLVMRGHKPIYAKKYRTKEQNWYKQLGGKGNPKNSRSIETDYTALRGLHIAEYEQERQMRADRLKMDAGINA